MNKYSDYSFKQILDEAHDQGMMAGEAKVPTPMVVQEVGLDNKPYKGSQSWYVPQGACGFAWIVTHEHGNGKFVRYLKSVGEGSKYYYGGHYVKWVGEFGQSIEQKEAYAEAYADVLQKYGIKAYAGSRLD
ncbi:MAG: hypothetical protein Unbinned3556contig1001_40 [Prokaryotic dsDNA virus sp.]|nr:MAG: hypothetical protein Unbinned3556contig1001_40 [Prokaryotic dsDNA virus sp.]|tara:strand:+ start:1901 stop:2293 length:393 start_codon:yes stop_codon:yes gene_type:complete